MDRSFDVTALAAGHNPDDLQPVSGRELALGELGRRDSLTVVLDYDTPRQ